LQYTTPATSRPCCSANPPARPGSSTARITEGPFLHPDEYERRLSAFFHAASSYGSALSSRRAYTPPMARIPPNPTTSPGRSRRCSLFLKVGRRRRR
jgi:hypothetical protein